MKQIMDVGTYLLRSDNDEIILYRVTEKDLSRMTIRFDELFHGRWIDYGIMNYEDFEAQSWNMTLLENYK